MFSQIICSVFPGDKKKKNIWMQKPQPQTSEIVSVECNLTLLVKAQPCVFQHAHKHPQAESCDARSNAFINLSPPRPCRVPGARLSQQHHVPILVSYTVVLGKSLQVGKGASSAPLARAPPPPGWPPVPLTCRRSVAGCHIFQPRGLAEETLARLSGCAWGRGAAVPLYIWSRCPRDVRRQAGHHRGVGAGVCEQEGAALCSAAGNLWARPHAGCPGAAARRLRSSARARERTAATAPSSSPNAAASGPARSEHARGRRPPDS